MGEHRPDHTWVITLRDGVTFHNGAPMDAAPVEASLEYSIATTVRAQAQLPITSMTPEDNKLTIVTSTPLADLPNILTDPMTGIQAVGDGINPVTDPQGTGPFQASEFVPHDRLELDAYPGYWGGEPKLGHVTVRSYADLQALGLAMRSGEVQVAAARALLAEPRLIVCDAITSALDVTVQASILELLAQLRQERELSMLFVSHDMAVVTQLSDRVAVMESGQIIEQGPVDQVIGNPVQKYTRLLIDLA